MNLRFYTCLVGVCVLSAVSSRAQFWQVDPTFAPVLESVEPPALGHILLAPGNKVIVSTPPDTINGVRPPTPARLNADGSLDTTFAPPQDSPLLPLAVYPDGRLLVQRTPPDGATSDVEIVRLTETGAVDPTFTPVVLDPGAEARLLQGGRILLIGPFTKLAGATQRGIGVLNDDGTVFGTFQSPFTDEVHVRDAAVLPDGRYLVVTSLGRVLRLEASGSIDPTFNAEAALEFPRFAWNVYPLPDGRLLVRVSRLFEDNSPHSLLRLGATGALDPSFSPDPVGAPLWFESQHSDGKIFYLTLNHDSLELRRLNSDGTADPGFVLTTPLSSAYAVTSPVRAGDGSYYFGSALTAERSASRFAVSHVFANGSIDPAFAPRFSEPAAVVAFVRQPDGKLVVAGAFDRINGELAPGVHNLVRLATDGTWDRTFTATLASGERVARLHPQPGGKIIARGTFGSGGTESYVRFTADGVRDANFRLPGSVLPDIAFDSTGRIFGKTFSSDFVLRRYTPDGDLDAAFAPVTMGLRGLFAVWDNGTFATTIDQWVGDRLYSVESLQRYRADGSPDPGFAIDRSLLPGSLGGLVALPDGRLLAIGPTPDPDATRLDYVRFTATGAMDYRYRGAKLDSGPLANPTLEAAGVMLDLLRDADAPVGARLRLNLSQGASTSPSDVGADGTLVVGATRYTGAATEPGADPAPTVLSIRDSGVGVLSLGGEASLYAVGGGLFPLSYQWLKDGAPIAGATSTSFKVAAPTPASAGNYAVVISNAHGSVTSAPLAISVDLVPAVPVIVMQPSSRVMLTGGTTSIPVSATGNPLPMVQWLRNGMPWSVPPEQINIGRTSVGASLLLGYAPDTAGVYTALATNASGRVLSSPLVAGFLSTTKVAGTAREVGPDILHPNGRTVDQILLEGTAAAITADPGQVTRMSFVDMNDDIVQMEFSGAGSVSLSLAGAPGPAAPASHYLQPGINYLKGHAAIVVAGANETSHLSVFTVGRANALYQALFRDDVTYDGVADLAYISILSANGKFGGLRCANVSFFASKGFTGVYAPDVQFTGPVYVGDIDAFDDAEPVLVLGSATGDTLITGGDLSQTNTRAVQVSGLTQLKFVAGSTSHGSALPAQSNQARLERDGVDVTAQIVVNPSP